MQVLEQGGWRAHQEVGFDSRHLLGVVTVVRRCPGHVHVEVVRSVADRFDNLRTDLNTKAGGGRTSTDKAAALAI